MRKDAQEPIWVHFDSWAGRTKKAAVLVKRNPKRSRVRLDSGTRLVPNSAITKMALAGKCCENEKRNMNGGCDNCGDPCL